MVSKSKTTKSIPNPLEIVSKKFIQSLYLLWDPWCQWTPFSLKGFLVRANSSSSQNNFKRLVGSIGSHEQFRYLSLVGIMKFFVFRGVVRKSCWGSHYHCLHILGWFIRLWTCNTLPLNYTWFRQKLIIKDNKKNSDINLH